MKKIYSTIFLLFILNSGCDEGKEIKTYSELHEVMNKEVRIITADSSLYTGRIYRMTDSSLVLSGHRMKGNIDGEFRGDLYFKDMVHIRTDHYEVLRTLLKAGITGAFFGTYLSREPESEGGDYGPVYTREDCPECPRTPSCPFVYSWNGKDFIMEGEMFSNSFCSVLENETAVVLNSMKAENGIIKLKVTNERPETHFFNTLKMYAVETDNDALVYADNRYNLRTIKKELKITAAADGDGKDITDLLYSIDNNYWSSDPVAANILKRFEDVIYIEMNTDAIMTDSISLILTAVNSELSAAAFNYLGDELQEEYIPFIRSTEVDPGMRPLLDDILDRSALKIDVLEDNEWIYGGTIYPEAVAVDFRKLLTLPLVSRNGKMVIRIKMLAGAWKINSLSYDSSYPEDIKITELKPLNGIKKLMEKDEDYLILLPGNEINLEYNETDVPPGKKITYAARGSGYLYYYIIDSGNIVKDLNPDSPRITEMKERVKATDIFLAKVYLKFNDLRKAREYFD
jgi:hypothetical protein